MGLHKIYSYALLTKREVKMAGYWPRSSFFLRFYGLRRSTSRSIKKWKKNEAISSHLNRTSLVKRVYILLA